MTIQEVIQAGDFSIIERYQNIKTGDSLLVEVVFLTYLGIMIAGIFWILFIGSCQLRKKQIPKKLLWFPKKDNILDFVMPTIVVGFLIYWFSFTFINAQDGMTIKGWVNDYVNPYVNSLPTETITLEAVDRVEEGLNLTTNRDENKEYVPVSVIYANEEGEGKTLNIEALIVYEEKEVLPYMEFKRVQEDLGYGYDKGLYNAVIHLPTGYYFNQ